MGAVFDAAIGPVTTLIEGTGFLYGDLCGIGNGGGIAIGGAVQGLSQNCNTPTIGGNGIDPSEAGAQPPECTQSAPGGPDDQKIQADINADAGSVQIQADTDQRTSDQNACDQFNQGCSSVTNQQSASAPPLNIPAVNTDIQPFAVDDKFATNGGPLFQIFTDIQMDPASPMISLAPQFVAIAARGKANQGAPPLNWNSSYSQAEFFYDCSDTFANCNNNGDAMWNYYWRARLRTFSVNAADASKTVGDNRCNFITGLGLGLSCTLDGRQETVATDVNQASSQVFKKLSDELSGGTSPAQVNMLDDLKTLPTIQRPANGPWLVVH
jgi:hypothetical protein